MIALNIPLVIIDDWKEPYKYIIIQCKLQEQVTYYVRGNHIHEFHADIFRAFHQEILKTNQLTQVDIDTEEGTMSGQLNEIQLEFICVGGGRLIHDLVNQLVHIYGYSQIYGQADHKLALKIIEQNLNYQADNLTMTNEGY